MLLTKNPPRSVLSGMRSGSIVQCIEWWVVGFIEGRVGVCGMFDFPQRVFVRRVTRI
jgi:hypothetical protein